MSQAAAPDCREPCLFDCTRCSKTIPRSETHLSRHALPCGHILCHSCTQAVAIEQKGQSVLCGSPGCTSNLGPVREYATAWCTQRAGRISNQLGALFADQGDVGSSVTEAGVSDSSNRTPSVDLPPWGDCSEHKRPVMGADTVAMRALCADCIDGQLFPPPFTPAEKASEVLLAAAKELDAESEFQKQRLAETTLVLEEFLNSIDAWAEGESTRIRAWEERERAAVSQVARDCVAMVAEVRTRRVGVARSLLRQHVGLRASIEEAETELSDLPSDDAARIGKLAALVSDRHKLLTQLSNRFFQTVHPAAASVWARNVTLGAPFGDVKEDNAESLANAPLAVARDTLDWARERDMKRVFVNAVGHPYPVLPPQLVSPPLCRVLCAAWSPGFCTSVSFLSALLCTHSSPSFLPSHPRPVRQISPESH